MNKQVVMAIAVLSVAGYSYAEETVAQEEAVQVTLEVRVNKDIADKVVAEAQEDAKALREKYEPVCGIDAVQTVVKRGVKEEEVTRGCCNKNCKCTCKKCCNGKCCGSCKSVQIEDDCLCEEHKGAEGSRSACEACDKIKEGNQRKREQQQNKSVRSLKDDAEFCHCEIVHEKCPDCGNVTNEFRCNCGKPKAQDIEEVVRCNCGKTKTNDAEQ